MKNTLLILSLFISLSSMSQRIRVLAGYDPANPSKPGWKFSDTSKTLRAIHPAMYDGDSTISFDSAAYYVSTFTSNASADSVILTFLNGRRLAAKAASAGGSGGGALTGWSTTGNSGTIANTNFLGTTDNATLRFRTNNIERLVLDSLGNAMFGNTVVTNTTTPIKFSMGGTTGSNAAGAVGNLKVIVYDEGLIKYGIGVTPFNMEYQVATGANHQFYVGGVNRLQISPVGITVPYITMQSTGQGNKLDFYDGGSASTRIGLGWQSGLGMVLYSYNGNFITFTAGKDAASATVNDDYYSAAGWQMKRVTIGSTTSVANRVFSVSSTTSTSHPYPSMTAAQRTALTMTSSNYGDHVYQTDAPEGVWVYKSTGWAQAY